jgi:hypothetical protein
LWVSDIIMANHFLGALDLTTSRLDREGGCDVPDPSKFGTTPPLSMLGGKSSDSGEVVPPPELCSGAGEFPDGTKCLATVNGGELSECILHPKDSPECILQKSNDIEKEDSTKSDVDGMRLRITVPKPPSQCVNVCFEQGITECCIFQEILSNKR